LQWLTTVADQEIGEGRISRAPKEGKGVQGWGIPLQYPSPRLPKMAYYTHDAEKVNFGALCKFVTIFHFLLFMNTG